MDFGYLKSLSEAVRTGSAISENFGDVDGSAIVGSEIDIINEAITAMSEFVNSDYAEVSSFNESITMHILKGEDEQIETLSESRWTAVKERIRKFWEMVKSFFSKLLAKIKFTWDSYMKSGEALVDKYGDKVGAPGSLSIEGYDYGDFDKWADNVKTNGSSVITGLTSKSDTQLGKLKQYQTGSSAETQRNKFEKEMKELESQKSKVSEAAKFFAEKTKTICGVAVAQGTLADIQKELLKKGRGDKTSKKTIKISAIGMSKIINWVKVEKDYSTLTDMVEALQDACDKAKVDMEKSIETNLESVDDTLKADVKSLMDSYIKTMIKQAEMTVATGKSIVAVVITLFKERYQQSRKAFIMVYNENNRVGKKKNESFGDFEDLDLEELMEF
jgi:hypothetical protein